MLLGPDPKGRKVIKAFVKALIDRTVKQRMTGSYALYILARRVISAFENSDVNIMTNGENWLQHRLAATGAVTAFDVGANRGEWALGMIAAAKDCRIVCYEAIPATFEVLVRNVPHPQATHVAVALSDAPGELIIRSVPDRPDLASAHADYSDEMTVETLVTPATTGDAEMARLRIDRITLLKIDTEGHDLSVLEGFGEALSAGRIDVIQFEYNHATLAAGGSLEAFFRTLENDFLICRLLPAGLEACGYHRVLDNFAQSNWIALRRGFVDQDIARRLNLRPASGLSGAALHRNLKEDPRLAATLGLTQ